MFMLTLMYGRLVRYTDERKSISLVTVKTLYPETFSIRLVVVVVYD